MFGMKQIAVLAFAGLVASGCAIGRSTIEAPVHAQIEAPVDGFAVVLNEPVDARVFETAPATPDIPSLDPSGKNPEATKPHAIGRKRNGYGKALGDLVLPETITVTDLVKSTVVSALHKAGYKVVSTGSPEAQNAPVLDLRIKEFWSWFNPGFWAITVSQKSSVILKGDVPGLEASIQADGRVEEKGMAAGDGAWTDILSKGLNALSDKLDQTLPPAPKTNTAKTS